MFYFQERDNLQIEVESFRTANGKLIKECDDLHVAFAKYRERHEKLHKGIKVIPVRIIDSKLNILQN